ncbi:reverse transcriptase domain-containing protein, partial [Tanacetum coccineum]
VRCTRLDVAFAQNITSRFQQNPGEAHWTAVKNILKYLRNTKDTFLVYGGNPEAELQVKCYCDVGFETDRDDTKSQTRKFIDELGVVPSNDYPIKMNCDNSAAIIIAKEPGIQKGARHFQRKYHYVRECIKTGEIDIVKVHTDENLADPFTKALASPKLTRHARSMGLRPARYYGNVLAFSAAIFTAQDLYFTRAGFEDIDFGWGKAIYVGPAIGVAGDPQSRASNYIPFRNAMCERGILKIISLLLLYYKIEHSSHLGAWPDKGLQHPAKPDTNFVLTSGVIRETLTYSQSPSPHASVFKRLKKYRSPSPQPRPRKEGGVFNSLGRKEPATSACSGSRQRSPQAKRTKVKARRRQQKGTPSRTTSQYSESEDSEGGHWKSKSRRRRSNTSEDDLSQPWTCEEKNPFTPRIQHFSLPRTRMPGHVKTYDGSGDPKDHLKLFQSATKTEGWAMPTWCHMFNSTLTGNARVWFDKLPKESINSYEDLRIAFRENYLQQTKHIKDPVEIHHIKQINGESTEDFMERYKEEVLDVEGAPECMRISGFMHGITHPGLIKRLYERIPSTRGSCCIQSQPKKVTSSWKPSEGGNKPNFKKIFKNKQRPDRKPDRFSLLTKTPKEIFALEKGKFKAPPPMVTPVDKRDPNKYCEFHSDTGHSTDDCMQLRKQIDEMIKARKLSQFIKELKQNDKPKAPKKREAFGKDKPLTILMIQPWERVAKPRITQSFSPEKAMSFPPLKEEDGTEGPMIIEVEMGGHFVHRVYIDGGASSKVLSPSQHNAIIGRPGIRKIHSVPSTAHGMLKFPVEGGTVTLQSSRVIPIECAMISGPSIQSPAVNQVLEEKINIAIYSEYPEQTVAIGSTLTEKGRKELCSLLNENLDIFAWKPADMTGVPRNIAKHRLNIREGYSASMQKEKRKVPLSSDGYLIGNSQKARTELGDVLWDFNDLKTKQLPQRLYPLPEINWKVVVPLWIFYSNVSLDAYKGITPNIIALRERGELIIYMAAAKEAISAVLMTDREGQAYTDQEEGVSGTNSMEETEKPSSEPWTLFTDGSSCVDGSGAGLILTNPEGAEFTYAMRFRFEATNNEAEYEALIAGSGIARKNGPKKSVAELDTPSRLLGIFIKWGTRHSGPFPEGPGNQVKKLIWQLVLQICLPWGGGREG